MIGKLNMCGVARKSWKKRNVENIVFEKIKSCSENKKIYKNESIYRQLFDGLIKYRIITYYLIYYN